jgi:hypothetical protein
MAKFAFPPRRPRANLAAITSMETRMKTYPVTLLQLSILTATRAVAAGGLALLLSGKVGAELRKGSAGVCLALARRLTFCSSWIFSCGIEPATREPLIDFPERKVHPNCPT